MTMKLTVEYKGDTLTREVPDSVATALWVYIERAEDLEVMMDPEDAGLTDDDAVEASAVMNEVYAFLHDRRG